MLWFGRLLIIGKPQFHQTIGRFSHAKTVHLSERHQQTNVPLRVNSAFSLFLPSSTSLSFIHEMTSVYRAAASLAFILHYLFVIHSIEYLTTTFNIHVGARLVNVTVDDDSGGDATTSLVYNPPSEWNVGQNCTGMSPAISHCSYVLLCILWSIRM